MPTTMPTTAIDALVLEVPDPDAARAFYDAAFGLSDVLRLRRAPAPITGFRAFTISLIMRGPTDVDRLFARALEAGATAVKPAGRSMWGYGGVLRSPDGVLWKIATPSKKDTGPATGEVTQVVVLIGAADVAESKRAYVDHGLAVARSFGRKYVEFDTGSRVTLGLYTRKGLAKDAGVPAGDLGDLDETTERGLVIVGGTSAFSDPDGFVWEAVTE